MKTATKLKIFIFIIICFLFIYNTLNAKLKDERPAYYLYKAYTVSEDIINLIEINQQQEKKILRENIKELKYYYNNTKINYNLLNNKLKSKDDIVSLYKELESKLLNDISITKGSIYLYRMWNLSQFSKNDILNSEDRKISNRNFQNNLKKAEVYYKITDDIKCNTKERAKKASEIIEEIKIKYNLDNSFNLLKSKNHIFYSISETNNNLVTNSLSLDKATAKHILKLFLYDNYEIDLDKFNLINVKLIDYENDIENKVWFFHGYYKYKIFNVNLHAYIRQNDGTILNFVQQF